MSLWFSCHLVYNHVQNLIVIEEDLLLYRLFSIIKASNVMMVITPQSFGTFILSLCHLWKATEVRINQSEQRLSVLDPALLQKLL